jgi:hypothetical protein
MKKALKAFDFQGFFCGAFIAKPYGGQLAHPVPKPERNAKETADLFFVIKRPFCLYCISLKL